MYAVFESGGKQYRAQPGDIVQVEKLEGDVGAAVNFDQILLLSKAAGENSQIWLGKPYLSGANVQTEIVGQGRGEKIVMVKMKRRKQYRRTQGHRQSYTQLLVTAVDNGSGEKLSLDASAKTERLQKFQSHLKPKGEAFSPKILGSRKRMAQAASAAHSGGSAPASASASKKTAAPKKSAAKKTAKKD